MLSNQEIFNKVATHLFEQGTQSLANGYCQYRGPDGLKCAVGCLIEDDEYSTDIENNNIQDLTWKSFRNFDVEGQCILISDLQVLHDFGSNGGQSYPIDVGYGKFLYEENESPWVSTENMRTHLRFVAEKFNLDPSIVNTLSFKDR